MPDGYRPLRYVRSPLQREGGGDGTSCNRTRRKFSLMGGNKIGVGDKLLGMGRGGGFTIEEKGGADLRGE